jgi:hypothetical protein
VRRPVAVIFAASGALATLVVSAPAGAYCRTKACDTEPSYGDVWDEEPQPTECVRNAQGCYEQGAPLFWPSSCLSFAVQRAGSKTSEIDYETADAIIEASFLKWNTVDCGSGPPSFRFVNKGAVDCRKAEYNQEAGNANIFMFRDDDWPYTNQIDTLALTTVTYNVETAEIYDSDVEVNTADAPFSTTDEPPDDEHADFEAVITHEIGHFLGLAHSEVNAATMRAIGYQLGTTGLRTLAPDDIEGVCQIYPPDEKIGSECAPRHGFTGECGEVDEGCTLRSPNRGSAGAGLFAACVSLGLFVRRTRRRTRT